MSDWTSGYVADIGYTYGYYAELNPLRARLAFLNGGLVPPAQGVHCELGFGQGVSVNIHAAASEIKGVRVIKIGYNASNLIRGALAMPTISMFYGIIISLYFYDNERHSLPHIHAKYQ